MNSNEIRQKFLDFFHSKQHHIVASAPMVIKNDPTLMFTNAGMNQFKDIFLGNTAARHLRIADTQKCLRVSGKHNDLEEVGFDTYHHTMFEMLGNWSFGDYFKKEAIGWAWELLTSVYGIDPGRLFVTVFMGDEDDKLPKDEEAFAHWAEIIPHDRILLGNKKDNFWEMGDTGPCGPCSEIHADLRSEEERIKLPGQQLVNTGHPEVIEIWNLVFIEFNRQTDGKLLSLPARHVDTGMGFERLTMVLQGVKSNYDTDIFQDLIQCVASLAGIPYGNNSKADVAMRVISDHLRAVAFAIADGQLPSNNKAGYVIRRILRRAIRFGYSFLGFRQAFLYKMVPVLTDKMGATFPELKAQQELIMKVMAEEENSFLRTLSTGIQRFEQYVAEHPSEKIINGQFAFELFDTYGFPVDLTQLMAREKQFDVDMEGFRIGMEAQKNRSRQAAETDKSDWTELLPPADTEFVGWDSLEAEIKIVKLRNVSFKGKELCQLVFDRTPFYAESGGQVGDRGFITDGEESLQVLDTVKENNLIIHLLPSPPKNPTHQFRAFVDKDKRLKTTRNHSATHLMHKALRTVLGPHVEQKGSLVDEERLRFDFSHFQKMSREEIILVETLVNQMIRDDFNKVERREIPMEEAKAMGAMALFGEKYGDKVRVIQFGDSLELCGGSHVARTGEIGFFKVLSESAIAAGIRRIEAITGKIAEDYVLELEKQTDQISTLLKAPRDIIGAVNALVDENNKLRKQLQELNRQKAFGLKDELLKNLSQVRGVSFLASRIDLDLQAIKDLAFEMRNSVNNLYLVLGNLGDGKAGLTVTVADELVALKGMDASKIVKDLAKDIKGGGGGQRFFATAGGNDPSGLDRALGRAVDFIP